MEKVKLVDRTTLTRELYPFPKSEAEKQERRKQWELRVIERHHQMARDALVVEQLISQAEPKDIVDKHLTTVLDQLSPNWRPLFLHLIRSYFTTRALADKEFFNLLSEVGKGTIENVPWKLGQLVFERITGELSQEPIHFSKKEAYFIMRCQNSDDFFMICQGRDLTTDEVKKSTASGLHYPYLVFKDERFLETSTLVINQGFDPDSSDPGRILTHERQHFINQKIFTWANLFSRVERQKFKRPPSDELKTGMRKIKDEVLAYLRQGFSGQELQETLVTNPLYNSFWSSLTASDKKMGEAVIERVKNFLDDQRYNQLLGNADTRGLLTYQLANVPLWEFPRWLTALENYYLQRLKLVRLFDEAEVTSGKADLNLFNFYDIFPADGVFPRQKIKAVFEKANRFREKAEKEILDLKIDGQEAAAKAAEKSSAFRQILQEATLLLRPWRREGVLMPYLGEVKSDERYVSVAPEIKEEILRGVLQFPQAEINRWAKRLYELRKSTASYDKSEKVLELLLAQVKKIVNRYNKNKGCAIEFMFFPSFSRLQLNVTFPMGPDEKDEPSQTARFILTIHFNLDLKNDNYGQP